jgi:leucyl-tRNA synthetase
VAGTGLENNPYNADEFFSEENLTSLNEQQYQIIKLTHKTIAAVEDEYNKMGFNRAIARIREFSNALEKFEIKSDLDKKIIAFTLNNLVLLFSPIMPHLAEELWQKLGNKNLISENSLFPKFNPKLTIDNNINIAIQINGKLKAVISMAKESGKEDLEKAAFENEIIRRNVDGKEVKRVIIVPGKLVNIVL